MHTKNTAKAVLGKKEHQLLTNVIRLHNMSLVASKHHRVFLNDQKLTLVLKNLGIEPKLNGTKGLIHNLHNLSLRDIFLTYTDKDIALLCKANYFMKNHHKKMDRFKNDWKELWMEVINLEKIIYGEDEKDQMRDLLYKCLKIKNQKELGRIKADTLDSCIKTQEVNNQKQKRLYKRSSFLSFILGEGASIDRNQDDLNKITDTFNSNFHLVHTEEEKLRGKLNQIIKSENILSKHEAVLYHNMQMIEMDSHQKSKRKNFEQKRTQQIEYLLELLQNSMVKQTIKKIHFGLQNDNRYTMKCQGNRCISQIRVSHKDQAREIEVKTTWAQDIVRNRVKVTCTPIWVKDMNNTEISNKTLFISTLHKTIQDNCFQQQIENPTKTKPQQPYKFCDNSFWHNSLRMTSPTDFDIPNVIIARTNNKLRLHCTVDMTLMINGIRRTCQTNTHIEITNTTDFKIQTENGADTIEAHTLTKNWDQTNNVFRSETDMEDNVDIIRTPTEDTGVDNMGNMFILADGRPHKVNIAISGVSITITALTILGGLCCCWKNPTCAKRLWSGCPPRGRGTQERKARIVDNILNQIRQELDANIDNPPRQMPQPPLPPNLEI